MYVAHITIPVSFDVDNDDQARAMLDMLAGYLASVSLPESKGSAGVEIIDYPDTTLQEVLPYLEPRAVLTEAG
jgi:hypothetical protein